VLGGDHLDRFGDLQDVGAGSLGDGDRDRRLAVHARIGLAVGKAVHDSRDVSDEDRAIAAALDRDVLDLLRFDELARYTQQEARVTGGHVAAGNVDVLVADRVDDVVEPQLVVVEPNRVDLNLDLAGAPTGELGVEYPAELLDVFLEVLAQRLELLLVDRTRDRHDDDREVGKGDLRDRGLLGVLGNIRTASIDAVADLLQRVLDDDLGLELEGDHADPLGRGGAHLLEVLEPAQLVLERVGDQRLDILGRHAGVRRGHHDHGNVDVRRCFARQRDVVRQAEDEHADCDQEHRGSPAYEALDHDPNSGRPPAQQRPCRETMTGSPSARARCPTTTTLSPTVRPSSMTT